MSQPLGVNLDSTVGFSCVLEVTPHVDAIHVLCTVSIDVAGWYLIRYLGKFRLFSAFS